MKKNSLGDGDAKLFDRKTAFLRNEVTGYVIVHPDCPSKTAYAIGWFIGKSIMQNMCIAYPTCSLLMILALGREPELSDIETYDPDFGALLRKAQLDATLA